MTKRVSTGKRLRFEVFKRDYFACQYCGAQPPDVVLVVDHIVPVAEGGETTIENLNTACTTCNQGKAAVPLGTRQVRPDADLLYLETQQEIAELERYLRAKRQRDAYIDTLLAEFDEMWATEVGTYRLPPEGHIKGWLQRYQPSDIEKAIRIVGPRYRSGWVTGGLSGCIAYANGVLKGLDAERVESDE